jgi:hypothetical protein
MSDPLRTDTTLASGAVLDPKRDVKIEQLLLRGLDEYFAAEYEQAINIWTRVLFLDRTHARARAYIDRARSALAERQRESEELLQHGLAAFQRGEGDEARRLLHAALRHGAPPDEALVVIDRLNRLEHTAAAATPVRVPDVARAHVLPAIDLPSARRHFGWVGWITVALALSASVFLLTASGVSWPPMLAQPPLGPAPARASADTLPLPTRGETALTRARALAASGRLRDALTTLDRIHATDPLKVDADRLRSDIQRQLLGLVDGHPPVPLRDLTDAALTGR